jgi:hypothetical protein
MLVILSAAKNLVSMPGAPSPESGLKVVEPSGIFD